jgi:hypothetical protein
MLPKKSCICKQECLYHITESDDDDNSVNKKSRVHIMKQGNYTKKKDRNRYTDQDQYSCLVWRDDRSNDKLQACVNNYPGEPMRARLFKR